MPPARFARRANAALDGVEVNPAAVPMKCERAVVAVFSFRTKERLTKQRIKEEVVRKARHVLKGAVLAA
jgi:hypothetical protein